MVFSGSGFMGNGDSPQPEMVELRELIIHLFVSQRQNKHIFALV